MLVRAFLVLLCLALAGCALRPDHVTIFCERDEADLSGTPRRQHTATTKTGISATYDLAR